LLTMVAGATTLQYLLDHPEIYTELDRLGDRLRGTVNAFCREQELPAQMMGVGSMFCTHFTDRKIESARDLVHQNMEAARAFYLHLLDEGVFIPNIHMGFLSAAHSEEDVDRIAAAHCSALKAVRDRGLFDAGK
jgi:glutamate-1-semialdehyde 2,1-aminomutase